MKSLNLLCSRNSWYPVSIERTLLFFQIIILGRCPPHAMMDLFLVLDSSSSVGKDNWNKTLFFIKDILDQFKISEDDVLVAAIR